MAILSEKWRKKIFYLLTYLDNIHLKSIIPYNFNTSNITLFEWFRVPLLVDLLLYSIAVADAAASAAVAAAAAAAAGRKGISDDSIDHHAGGWLISLSHWSLLLPCTPDTSKTVRPYAGFSCWQQLWLVGQYFTQRSARIHLIWYSFFCNFHSYTSCCFN